MKKLVLTSYFFVIFYFFGCGSTNNYLKNEFTLIKQADEYELYSGGKYYKYQGTIIKDTIANDYKLFSNYIKSNFVPKKNDIKKAEELILDSFGNRYKNYYRQYGFVTKNGKHLVEISILTPYGIKSFKNWKEKPFEYIVLDKVNRRKMFEAYIYYEKNKGLVNSKTIRKKLEENTVLW